MRACGSVKQFPLGFVGDLTEASSDSEQTWRRREGGGGEETTGKEERGGAGCGMRRRPCIEIRVQGIRGIRRRRFRGGQVGAVMTAEERGRWWRGDHKGGERWWRSRSGAGCGMRRRPWMEIRVRGIRGIHRQLFRGGQVGAAMMPPQPQAAVGSKGAELATQVGRQRVGERRGG
jgi:hypothetical protein